jgi:hypothetical protein
MLRDESGDNRNDHRHASRARHDARRDALRCHGRNDVGKHNERVPPLADGTAKLA